MMHRGPFDLRMLRVGTIAVALALTPLHLHAASDEQSLRDQYKDKVFVLRGFPEGTRLTYDSAGLLVSGPADPGDWTVDGFVRITGLGLSGRRLTIRAERLYLGVAGGMGFQLTQLESKDDKNTKDARKLRIEVAVDPSGETAEAALAKIFLTSEDHFAELVPNHWKPCVLAASTGKAAKGYRDCRFSPEFASIPGVIYRPAEDAGPGNQGPAVAGKEKDDVVSHAGKGITPPKAVFQPTPSFSEEARGAKYQDTVSLAILVEDTGRPQSIRIVKPVGYGLDRQAVEAVARWRFDPALRDGEPVAYEVQVQVDFHLY